MTTDTTAPEFDAYWRTLAVNDREAHAAEADRAIADELEGLRIRCAELGAALTQARAAIEIRHELLTAQSAAIAERDSALTEAREAYDRVVTSRRWRLWDLLGTAARRGRGVGRRVRRAAGRGRGRA